MTRDTFTSKNDLTMLTDLEAHLTTGERRIARALFELNVSLLDVRRSAVRDDGEFIHCAIASLDDSRCPFEVHFGRRSNVGRFNFYVGLGAEVYNYEEIDGPRKQGQLASDLYQFLRSRITCESQVRDGAVVRAVYTGDLSLSDSLMLRASYKAHAWAFFGLVKQRREYVPWL